MPRIIGDVEDLATTVKHLAHSDSEKIKREAEKKVEQIKQEAEQKAEEEKNKILRQAEVEVEQIRRQQQVELSQEQRRKYFKLREEMLEEVWNKTEEELRTLRDNSETYLEILKHLCMEAISVLGPGIYTVSSCHQGMKLMSEAVLKSWEKKGNNTVQGGITLEKAENPAGPGGGLILSEKEGRRQVDATFSTRLTIAREEIREEVFRKLVES